MKIRNNKVVEYRFWPVEGSKIDKGSCYIFKYKSHLMRFLNKNVTDGAINGIVAIHVDAYGGASYTSRQYQVWFNQRAHQNGAAFKLEMKQLLFRGKKFICKPKTSRENKIYFAFSEKIISLMCRISDKTAISAKDAEKLVTLFKKRGFKDFEPSEEDWNYINGHISDGIDFWYWSDRCGWLRTKTIIEYFRREGLIKN